MNKVRISSDARFKRFEKKVRNTLQASLKHLKKSNAILTVYLIRDSEMRALHKEHKGKDAVTNVLCFKEPKEFPHPELPPSCVYLGEIYLAPAYISEKQEDIRRLSIHGLLHLLGYTHDKKNDRIKMERMEKSLIAD